MRKILLIMIAIILVCVSGYFAYATYHVELEPTLSVWYWNDGEFNEIKSYIIRDVLIYANTNGFVLEKKEFDESMMSHDEYLKRLSIALSTGQCDITISSLAELECYSNSLLSLENIENYKSVMPVFQFDKYFPLEYVQPTLGVNEQVFKELGIEYDENMDIYDFFEIKKKWRANGNTMILDYYEVSEIVDEVLLTDDTYGNLESLDYKSIYNDYLSAIEIIESGSYDISEMELNEYYVDYFGRREETRPFFTMYSGLESNLLTHALRYTRAPYFKMFTDIRFRSIADDSYSKLGIGISAFSQHKDECEMVLNKVLGEKVQSYIYKQGFASIKGYEAIKSSKFNKLIPSFEIERNSYLSASEEDPRFDFKSISLADIKFREFMVDKVIDAARTHIAEDEYQFIESCENEVMKILIETGER